MRWIVAIVVAAVVGSIAYSVGVPPEVVYILRSIARHLVNTAMLVVEPIRQLLDGGLASWL